MKQSLLGMLKLWGFKRGEFTLASGKTSDFYIDVRPVALSADGHWKLGRLLYEMVKTFDNVQAIAGVELGGCPLASAVSYTSALDRVLTGELGGPQNIPLLPAFYIRKAPKGHGMGKIVEAPFPYGADEEGNVTCARVVLLEDVVTTGGSTIRAIQALREAGHNVVGVCVVVDRKEGGVGRITTETGLTVRSLFTRSDFIRSPDAD